MEEQPRRHHSLQEYLNGVQSKIDDPPSSCLKQKCIIKGKIIISQTDGLSSPSNSASLRLYSCTQVDPKDGNKGKLSERAYLKCGKVNKLNGTKITTYNLKFKVEAEFGIPGAFVMKNQHKHKFFLQSATLQVPNYHRIIHFDCRSWVYPDKNTQTERLFFSNTSYLPSQTPEALMELRKEELVSLRGDGTGERKEWDRIYDYDYYNDLGNPDKGGKHTRPILGGSDSLPYPRRGRTGCPRNSKDPLSESRPGTLSLDVYVPPDERLSPKKLSEFTSNSIQATLHFLVPKERSLLEQDLSSFKSFDEISEMFSNNRSQGVEGWIREKLKSLVSEELFKEITHALEEKPTKIPIPQIIAENGLAWKDDAEFGRQMLAGINSTVIRSIGCYEEFPLKSKYGWSSIRESHIERNLDGLTLTQDWFRMHPMITSKEVTGKDHGLKAFAVCCWRIWNWT